MPISGLEPVAHAICATRSYTFKQSVGAGAYKQTFEVHEASGRAVALKVYAPDASTDRAQREVDAMLQCNHPAIARLEFVDAITHGTDRHVYCVEEFLGGGTLAALSAAG